MSITIKLSQPPKTVQQLILFTCIPEVARRADGKTAVVLIKISGDKVLVINEGSTPSHCDEGYARRNFTPVSHDGAEATITIAGNRR